jgi:hypothetical protein
MAVFKGRGGKYWLMANARRSEGFREILHSVSPVFVFKRILSPHDQSAKKYRYIWGNTGKKVDIRKYVIR